MFTIPNPFFLVIDDLGWFCGDDDRKSGGASRTCMPRRHCAADYAAVNALGKAVNMKINCAFVLSEWDPDNRLKSIPYLSKYSNWDNASHLDTDEAKRCVEVINNSEYIDFALHGLNHGYYAPFVDTPDVSDFYYYKNGEVFTVNEKEIRQRIDAFYDILNFHGINKKITSAVMPSGVYRWNELSHILHDYGIKYVTNPSYGTKDLPSEDAICGIENSGIITCNRLCMAPWDSVDAATDSLPSCGFPDGEKGVFGLHWPNILNADPNLNMQTVDRWIRYINNCSEHIETFISPDIETTMHQFLYLTRSEIENSGNEILINVSKVPISDAFYVNLSNPPVSYDNCLMTEYKRHDNFTTYKVAPKDKKIRIRL